MDDYAVWLDPETELPIRIELEQNRSKRTIIWSEFDFSDDMDETLFSTTAPEGFTVEKKTNPPR